MDALIELGHMAVAGRDGDMSLLRMKNSLVAGAEPGAEKSCEQAER